MKRIYYLFITSSVVILSISCKTRVSQQLSKKTSDTVVITKKNDLIRMNEKTIRDYYRELAEVGIDGVTVMPIDKKVEYTDLAVELNFEILKRMGFQPISSVEAQKAIKKYYNIDISESNNSLFKKGLRRYVFKDGLPQERLDQRRSMDDGATETLFCFWYRNIFVPKYNYIIFHPIIEGATQLEGFDDEDADNNVLKKGKLSYRNDEELFYKNQFIFHDSKAALTWLMNNDRNFLRDLFLEYGYDKSDVINKMMLDEIKVVNRIPEADETKALFASRGANGKLLIHRGLLEYMLKHVNEENEYFLMLDQYASTLLDLRNYPEFDSLTKEERYRIGAYVGYYYGLLFDKGIGTSIDINGFGHGLCYDEDLRDYLKRNKYFHLPGFEDIAGKHYRRYRMDIDIEMEKMRDE